MSFRRARARSLFAAAVAALSAVALFAPRATADTIYSTFGPGDAFDDVNAYNVTGPHALHIADPSLPDPATVFIAAPFTVNQATTFDAARLALQGQASPDFVDLKLAADDGSGAPGAVLEDIGQEQLDNLATTLIEELNYQIYQFDSVTHPLLSAGTYWLVATPYDLAPLTDTSYVAWAKNNAGFTGVAFNVNATGWDAHTGAADPVAVAPAFDVTGSPVPLPAAAPAGAALLAATAVARRRRQGRPRA